MHILGKSRYLLFLVALLFLVPTASFAQIAIGLSIHVGPPALPVYAQPACPHEGFMWTPGYWAYGSMGYYWVPGVWVAAPQPGFLWTPGYWGFAGGAYGWHGGYWGAHVGFYGGINYGFGYGGAGLGGGEWVGGAFRYNTAVMNVNTSVVHNTYVNNTVVNNTTVVNHAAFNGAGGVTAQPTAQEQSYAHENHVQPTASQVSHEQTASSDRSQWASTNHGKPSNLAMDKVGGRSFNQQGHVATAASPKPAAHEAPSPGRPNNAAPNGRAANGGKPTPAENSGQKTVNKTAADHSAPKTNNAAAERSGQKTNNNVAADHKATAAKPAPQAHKQASKPQNKPSAKKNEGKEPKK